MPGRATWPNGDRGGACAGGQMVTETAIDTTITHAGYWPMDLQEFQNQKKKVTDFLRGFDGPAPFSQISRQLSCSQETAHFVISEMINEGSIRMNNTDMTYLKLTGETVTYSLA